MTKQAYRDENGNIKYRVISDRKKCITLKEFHEILNIQPFQNAIFSSGREFRKGNPYYFARFNHWAGFPLVVAEIHSKFGRGVEVEVCWENHPSCVMYIRAYRGKKK